ncbi:hypothetical protein HLH26_08475 [Gluconacetobacter sp. 1b LMG 1731]|uniref:Uncharacterized protein n=1 Tax=Gluconacetobacter dulcium TaxID=2729096 RepID=A0A7W4IKL0_9PROT|nr:hypothetical protein [Gluconacetobacter dulcium]MBB2164575.1 hypothetical protein [Gluconacetobacter dulcium]MBB2193658.1 hypothetical protein [Gluconacetobacter dulcium]
MRPVAIGFGFGFGFGVVTLAGVITMAACQQMIGVEIFAAAMLSAVFVMSKMTTWFG